MAPQTMKSSFWIAFDLGTFGSYQSETIGGQREMALQGINDIFVGLKGELLLSSQFG